MHLCVAAPEQHVVLWRPDGGVQRDTQDGFDRLYGWICFMQYVVCVRLSVGGVWQAPQCASPCSASHMVARSPWLAWCAGLWEHLCISAGLLWLPPPPALIECVLRDSSIQGTETTCFVALLLR